MNPVNAPRYRVGLIVIGLLAVAAGSSLYLSRPHGRCGRAVELPAGYHPMTVQQVSPSGGGGFAVDLIDARRSLTIYVGASEGNAIQLRSAGQRFVRPLTVDLLDSVMSQLGGRLERVQVDALVGNTFHGSLHLRQGARALQLDARPSDAIALALGHQVPILVSDSVLSVAGHPVD
jgi:uncharacterized protein